MIRGIGYGIDGGFEGFRDDEGEVGLMWGVWKRRGAGGGGGRKVLILGYGNIKSDGEVVLIWSKEDGWGGGGD